MPDDEGRARFETALGKVTGGREADVRIQPDERQLARLRVRPMASGPGRPSEVVPSAFLQRQLQAAGPEASLPGFRRPQWVAEMAHRGAPPKEVLGEVARRSLENPTEAMLREAQIIVNDLGRMSGGGELVRGQVSQELIDKLTRKEA